MNKFIRLLTTTALFGLVSLSATANIAEHSEVKKFIDEMNTKHHLNKAELVEIFEQISFQPRVVELIKKPYEAKPWYQYRKHFISQTRIRQGVEFWRKNKPLLMDAYQKYAVPPEIIVAILGVETQYGRFTGK